MQSKPTQELLKEYAIIKRLYKKVNRKYQNQPKADYLLRYSYDLMYAAVSGDSLAAERLLFLNKDFKLFRDGLDLEDLIRNREHLYYLYIADKPKAYRERFQFYNHFRY